MNRKEKIVIDIEKCNGYRCYELACSIHHLKSFERSNSSIKIYRNDGNGTIEISLLSTCDACVDEKNPLL